MPIEARLGIEVVPDTYKGFHMRLRRMFVFMFVAVGLSSCGSWHDVATIQVVEEETGLLVHPMVIEFDSVSTQMIVDTFKFVGVYYDKDKPTLYKEAMAKCILKHGFDMLISPSYKMYCETAYGNTDINTSSNIVGASYANGMSYNVVISGYPAYNKRIRPATPEDVWMIPFYNRTDHIEMNSIQQSSQSISVLH